MYLMVTMMYSAGITNNTWIYDCTMVCSEHVICLHKCTIHLYKMFMNATQLFKPHITFSSPLHHMLRCVKWAPAQSLALFRVSNLATIVNETLYPLNNYMMCAN